MLRLKREMQQEDLAAAMGKTTRTIRKWEKGERVPGFFEAISLARALGFSVAILAGERDPEERQLIARPEGRVVSIKTLDAVEEAARTLLHEIENARPGPKHSPSIHDPSVNRRARKKV